MYFIRNVFYILMILLFFFSIYKDLTIGTPPFNEDNLYVVEQKYSQETENNNTISRAEVFVQPGDTVLSITEVLNNELSTLDVTKVLNDFKLINPGINPYDLKSDTSYFFPLYIVYH